MNVQLPVHMDKPAFLAWVQGREERYELVDGRVVMMTRPSRNHARIVGNLVVALRRQLDLQWETIAEFGLDAGPRTLRYPDIVVDRAGGGGRDYTAATPVLLIEVLSSSTARFDLGDKTAEFLRIPSLLAYVAFAQDEHKAWVWIRTSEAFPPGPRLFEGTDAIIAITTLNLNLSLSEIYARVDID